MQKKLWKKARRVLAGLMAVAMIMMDMSGVVAYADETTSAVLNVSEMTAEEITETKVVGDFTIVPAVGAEAGKGVIVESNSKSIDGFEFTQRMKLNGTGSAEKRSIAYTAASAATMTVYAMSGSGTEDRNLVLASADGTVVGTQVALGASISKLTYDIPSAGTYYLYSAGSGINVYYVAVTAVVSGDDTTVETPTEWSFVGDDYTGQASYNGLTITGGSKHDATYGMRIANGSIVVPVSGACNIEVGVGYSWEISFDDSTEVHLVEPNGGTQTVTYSYAGEAGTVTIKVGSTVTTYISSIKVVAKTTEDGDDNKETNTPDLTVPESVAGKIDVWDFAAEKLDESVYTNKLSVDVINSWYGDSVDVNTLKQSLPAGTHTAGELILEMGGKTNNRIRTENTAIARYDAKSYTIGDVKYNGCFYSNSGASSAVYVGITAKAGDILTFVVSSNGGDSTIGFADLANPDVVLASEVYEASNKAEVITFYAPADGTYKVYSADEKLIVARVYRESTNAVTVSGNVTAPEALSGYSIAFTNQKNGAVTTAEVTNGSYSVSLNDQYTYDVALVNANGYIITSAATVEVAKGSTAVDFPITVMAVSMVTVKGTIAGLSAEELEKATISFTSDEIYQPEITFEGMNYSAKVETGITYNVVVEGINDYMLVSPTTVSATEDTTINMIFEKKPTYTVTINPTGATVADLAEATFTFTNLNEEGYVYTFTGTEGIALRDGVYSVGVENSGIFVQKLTSNLTVNGAAVTKTIAFDSDVTESVEYKETVTVGANDCDYTTINDALDAVRAMPRTNGERVTIAIQPGDYEEMLVIDVSNVTLKNASDTPSIETKNKGVDIDENAVRITGYYGHGYTYYSMGNDGQYDAELLAVNKENGYASYENPGAGTIGYWNATVTVSASGFEAEGIIFENSFNQYVSEKAADDVIVAQSSAKEGLVPRASMEAGDTTVQNKSYVERAAALAIANNCKEISFDNCKFIGRQDTLYGGTGVTAAFYDCAIYGGTDYIFGGMTAVFAKCDLVFNTSEDSNDVGYITAAQTDSGRGMLLYNCTVTSTEPGVDTASEYPSKAGYFGRPWATNTGEAVFYYTIIEATHEHWYENCPSLIQPVGWLSTLKGESVMSAEYGTYEMAANVDNQSARATWASTLTEPVLVDGTTISVEAFLGNWKAFAGKDMTIELPDGKVDNTPEKDPEEETPSTTTEFVLDAADVATFGEGAKADGDKETAGTEDYFTLLYSAKTKVETKEKTFDDGYVSTQRINFGSGASTTKDAIKFTTSNPATVKIWWGAGDASREMTILNEAGTAAATTSEGSAKDALYISELELTEAGTYYLGGTPKKNYIFKVEVTETPGGVVEEPRADWATVEAPVITKVALNTEDEDVIEVTVSANVGHDGADKLTVVMTDEAGNQIAAKNSLAEKTEHVLSFEPESSGTYTFSASIIREDEEDKVAAETKTFAFVLPLTKPNIKGVYNVGKGNVEVEWDAVKEAEKYIVSVEGTDISVETTKLIATIEGLEIGKTYKIKVVAVRGNDTAEATVSKAVKDEVEVKWYFSAYGSSTNTKNNGYEVLEDGSVRVYSTDGKGKIVPGSTDGLAYYYTTIDPDTTNFTLSATAVVNNWTLSNGQEGFGIMASDRAGVHGDATAFWNNAYMALASKVEYYYDIATGEVTDDTSAAKISMKLGVGSQEKVGVTAENLAAFDANDTATINEYFSSTTTTLESSCGPNGAGTYNIVGNYTGVEPTGTVENTVTEFKFTIQKNNTGYFVSYTDENGVTTTKKYYDTEALSQIEEDSVCLGFFASRNADVTFKDITFTTIAPEDDVAVEERPVTLVTPNYAITSATVANSADYELVFVGNAAGKLVIIDSQNKVLLEKADVKANEKISLDVKLALGNNTYKVTFTPDLNYVPSEYEKLSSYEAVSFTHVVSYKSYGEAGASLYVSPSGSTKGNGTKENPLDIYTAVKYVQAGQTIVIMEGTYNLKSTVKVERGIDGTAENMIYMVADPEATSRPVFDFGGCCAGMVLAGDYWYLQGFDVTRSADAQKGIQVSGNNNVLDQINTYRNGNTGIQISRYLSTDNYEDWPANNLILNCTSYLNADKGYEDADGFAAKLTVGDGNVFDGCIAYNNADDGWDLYAKVQTGSIGVVTIQNCIAFKNGYDLDANGNEISAGNGNGFKMGGDSMVGGHILKNSVAFMNKAKGIDSNSCPDIKVYSSIAFNNGSYNVAFYTNTAANTDYLAYGVVSYRTENLAQEEQLKLKGTQNEAKVYGVTNFFWDVAANASKNTQGTKVEADWFESLEFTGAFRNADGTINLNGFLAMTDKAEIKAGLLPELATPSAAITIGKETSGTVTDTDIDSDTASKPDTEGSGSGSGSNSSTGGGNTSTGNANIGDFIQNIENALNKKQETVKETISSLLDGLQEFVEGIEVEVSQDVVEKAAVHVQALVEKLLAGESIENAISQETAEKILRAVKAGEKITPIVVAEPILIGEVLPVEKNLIEAALEEIENVTTGILQYFELSVLLCTESGEVLGSYNELPDTLRFTIKIPENMDAEGRTFVVIRVHNEEVSVLDTIMNGDGTLTFETDRFSTYALAYKEDVVNESQSEATDTESVVEEIGADTEVDVKNVEEANDFMLTIGAIAALFLAVCGLIITKRRQSQSK